MVLRICKMIDISGFPTALECNEFVFGRGSANSVPPDSLARLRGSTSKGRGGRKERKGDRPLTQIPGSVPELSYDEN